MIKLNASNKYKKTKIGWIPVDWECSRAGDNIKFLGGNAFSSKDTTEHGVSWLKIANAGVNKIKWDVVSYLPFSFLEQYKEYALEVGDIIMALTRPILDSKLKIAIIQESDLPCLLNQRVGKLTPNNKSNKKYIYYIFQYSKIINKINVAMAGTDPPNIGFTDLKKILIPLPPLPEQKKIAKILSTWDRAIELTEKLITKCELRKKGLVQLTISMRQLAINSKQLSVNTKEWENVKLGDIFKRVKRKNSIGEPRVLTASGEHGLIDQKEYFNRSVAGKNLSGYYLLKKGEFAYNRSFMNGYPYGAIKRLERYNAGIVSTLYLCFALQNKCCDESFYTHLFESGVLNKELRCIVQMGARAHGLLNVTASDFLNIKIALPPLDEQKHIAKILDTTDKEINKLKSKLEALKEQKKGMMQKLLTGEVRAPEFIDIGNK